MSDPVRGINFGALDVGGKMRDVPKQMCQLGNYPMKTERKKGQRLRGVSVQV